MYCIGCGNTLGKNDKFCAKCGTTTELVATDKERNPISKLIHWYVDGLMEDPFWWVFGTCVIIGMAIGVFNIGPCSGWLG